MSRLPKLFLALVFLNIAFSSPAAAPAHGKQRLRELVVFPTLDLSCQYRWNLDGSLWQISAGMDREEISLCRKAAEQQPDDARIQEQLGFLLGLDGQADESKACYEKAERICRNRLATSPDNGLLLVDFGKALSKLGKDTEAESIYRKSVLISSNQWRCWAGLGYFLEQQSFAGLLPEHLSRQIAFPNVPPKEVLDYRPTPNAIKNAEALSREADRCLDRAMTLATNEWEAYIQHAGYTVSSNMSGCFMRHFRNGETVDEIALRSILFSKAVAADMRKAAMLSTKDYKLIGVAAFLDLVTGTVESNPAKPELDVMPDASLHFLHEGMARLEKLSQDSDNKLAAGALQNLAMLKLMQKDSPASVADLARRSVKLDPTRDQSWDLLLGCSLHSASLDELQAMCEARLKQKDSARNHLILGKLFTKQSKWDNATTQTYAALKLEPDNINAHLMQLALLLRQSTDDQSLQQTVAPFNQIQELLVKMPESAEKRECFREFMLNVVILYGLSSEEELQKKAKEMIVGFVEKLPNDEDVKNIREAIE